ncbi:FkbM family methyltransferase [Caulobacter sp. S45]|uniref:FkbM family methyltransferase n=1 Tax=Caulobacter sp. S45 TaxID=1641861 RepID=UPI001575A182|nr:FkbM family methyltransferase [Caulobacter sp. S45]
MSRYEASELAAALYDMLLQRAPEPGAAETHGANAELHKAGPAQMIEGFLRSPEFAYKAPAFLRRFLPDHKLIWDHSQTGEVAFILRSIVNDSARRRFVVDVGARGRERSNSYDLMKQFGWRGLLVEANPNLIDTINEEFADLDVTLVNCAISDFEGEASFYFGLNDDVSSLYKDGLAAWGPVHGECRVPVRRLPSLLDEIGAPHDFDLLSLDIEGADVPTLNDLIGNSPYRPERIVIEIWRPDSRTDLAVFGLNSAVIETYELIGEVGANLVLKLRASPTSSGSGPAAALGG